MHAGLPVAILSQEISAVILSQVRLKEHGSELIEVADNGSGISPDDYDSIALKYHTSKISSFEDVAQVQSFGFRGEALSSLCAVSSVVFTTKTREQDAGMKLTFDQGGNLQGMVIIAYVRDCGSSTCQAVLEPELVFGAAVREVAARSPGTTASVKDLFKTLPVRLKAFQKNLKREFVKVTHLLQAYAVICTSVRFIATNQVMPVPNLYRLHGMRIACS
jgi:DNA mismatch repair protein PMS2